MVIQDSYITMAWLVLLIILLIVEIITVGLTSIWAAGGALAALILNILGGDRILCGDLRASLFYTAVCGKIHQYPAGEDELRRDHRQDDPDRGDSR